jgi:hypothetical protein
VGDEGLLACTCVDLGGDDERTVLGDGARTAREPEGDGGLFVDGTAGLEGDEEGIVRDEDGIERAAERAGRVTAWAEDSVGAGRTERNADFTAEEGAAVVAGGGVITRIGDALR